MEFNDLDNELAVCLWTNLSFNLHHTRNVCLKMEIQVEISATFEVRVHRFIYRSSQQLTVFVIVQQFFPSDFCSML